LKTLDIKIYRITNLNVDLYVCETFSFILKDEHRLRVFKNRVLRNIFGPKRDEVIKKWRKLHNKDLYDTFSSPNIIRVIKPGIIRLAEHVARIGRGQVHTGLWWGNLRA